MRELFLVLIGSLMRLNEKIEVYSDPLENISKMGKGRRAAFKAIEEQNKRRRVEVALIQVGQIAEKMIQNPFAEHDFVALKELLAKLYQNTNLSAAPKDIRESFNSIFNTTTQIVDIAIRDGIPKESSILDRRLRGSIDK